MGTRRLGFALIAAVLISLAVTSFFYVKVMHRQGESRVPTRRVIAAAGALQPGLPLTAENLTEVNWPTTVTLAGLIDRKEDAIGHILIFPVEANEPVLKHDLAPSGSYGLAAKIPSGMRATSVKTNEVMNVSGFLFPGSHVDVLVTLRGENSASTVTRTVLQDVQVLATGSKTDPDPNGKPENVSVVTLLVTPEESEKLALAQNQAAQNQGTIHFVLRNGGDVARPDTGPVDMAALSGVPRKIEQKPRRRRNVAVKIPEPATYNVETLVGGKVLVSKFPESQ